jgi:hypothetical protein
MPVQALRKVGDAGMYLMSLSDSYNRMASIAAAKGVLEDIAQGAGPKYDEAIKALGRQPLQIRRGVIQALKAGKQDEAYRQLASHLIASTQFYYNKGAMSQFGRSVGPMLSTFSSWPTAMLGNVTHQVETRGLPSGAIEFSRQMLGPLAMAVVMQQVLFGEPSEMSTREKYWVGQGGLTDWAGVTALTGISQFGRPPIVDLVVPFIQAPGYLIQGEEEKYKKTMQVGIGKALGAFAPGASLLSFIRKDLPIIMTGSKKD